MSSLFKTTEGWYVEYKCEVSSASSVAKSISAFANTYGGWLFYGIEEKSKSESVAGTFVGIQRKDLDAALQRIRQAAAISVMPSPHFESQVVWGPSKRIGLAADHAVICISIAQSSHTPHVHRDGRIYRRVADSSEPKPENDRFILDQLWKRSQEVRKAYKRWLRRDPEFSDKESETPYLRLLLTPELWPERDPSLDVDIDEVRSIMGDQKGVVLSLPFDSVHRAAAGFVARQTKNNDPGSLTLTWLLRTNLVSDIYIPLRWYEFETPELLELQLSTYEQSGRFCEILAARGHREARIIDLNILYNLILGIVEIQSRLMTRANHESTYYAKARLLNVWRMCPFLDVEPVVDIFEAHGVPMCLTSTVVTPEGTDPETFQSVPFQKSVQSEEARIHLQAMRILLPVARIFGFGDWVLDSVTSEKRSFYQELQDAGIRALEHQKNWSGEAN